MTKALLTAMALVCATSLASCSTESQASTPEPAVKVETPSPAEAPAAKPAAEPATEGAPKSFSAPPKPGQKATCPVMESEFVVTDKSERSEYQGKHVAFCCPGCKEKFDADPPKYLK